MCQQRMISEATVRILVVDDHDLFRTGLASLLTEQDDFDVVGQVSGGRRAVQLARELKPDVVLMDMSMPDLDGDKATRLIAEADPEVRILVLTVLSDEAAVAAAIRAGACGYLVKDSPMSEVFSAIRAAAQGTSWFSSQAAVALRGHLRHQPPREPADDSVLAGLTARELAVLRLLGRGDDNFEIAADLGISPRTAKAHVSSILAKLEVSNRVQAAVVAAKHGLV
jgi:two-component system, NarL family, response regulator LiaR